MCLDHLLFQLSVHRSRQSIIKTVSGLRAIFPSCFKPGNEKKQKGVSCWTLKKSFKITKISFDVFNSIQREGTFLFSIFLLVSCTYQKVIKLFHIWNLLINVHINAVIIHVCKVHEIILTKKFRPFPVVDFLIITYSMSFNKLFVYLKIFLFWAISWILWMR